MKMTLKDAIINGNMRRKVLKVSPPSPDKGYVGTGTWIDKLIPVKYVPDVSSFLTISKEETGAQENQTFETERLGRWWPVEVMGKVFLVSESVTKTTIILGGLIGARNGENVMQKVSKLYSNEELDAEGLPVNFLVNKILPCEASVVQRYWLPEPVYRSEESRGGFLVANGTDNPEFRALYAGDGQATPLYISCGLRIMISLPENVMVDIPENFLDLKEGVRIFLK